MLHSEAIDFLVNVLKIDEIEAKIKSDKLKLLQEVCLKVQRNIPFQNLSLLAMDSCDRRLPTTEDIQSAYISKIGGICYSAACFSQQLLHALGYDAFLIACTITHKANGQSFTHAACIVKGFSGPEERYLVDFGAGFPTFEPVPLHSLPKVYIHAFQETKFVNQKDGSVARLNKVGTTALGDLPSNVDDGWQIFYEFEEIPRDDEFLAFYQTPIYTDPSYGAWFLKGLKMSYYPENEAFTINDYVFKKWKKGGKFETIVLKDENELSRVIKDYFPSLANIDVHKAVFNWNENKMSFGAVNNELVLTQTEAIGFLKYTLRIDDVENKIRGPKFDLLLEFTKSFYEHIPFQNLSLLVSLKERHLPSNEEMKSDYFAGIGGMCYTSAIFGQKLLKTLGYDTFLIAITVPSTEKVYTHVAFVVKDTRFPGHRYLVDLGAGYPTFEPVPLHFLPLYYKQTFLEYKYIRQENGVIVRYHKVGDHFQLGRTFNVAGGNERDDGWQKYYEFEEIERDEAFIKTHQKPVYLICGYGTSWLSTGLKMSIYPSATEAYIVSDSELKKWTKEKETETTVLECLKDLKVSIKNYFPTLVDVNLNNVFPYRENSPKN